MSKISKKELQLFLRDRVHPDVLNHISRGGGLLDILSKGLSTATKMASTGLDFYNTNKDTIHKAVNMGVKYAPVAIDAYKKLRGGSISAYRAPAHLGGVASGGMMSGGRMSGGKLAGGSMPTGGVINAVARKKSSAWVDEIKAYQAKHPHLSYKEAMIKASELRKKRR